MINQSTMSQLNVLLVDRDSYMRDELVTSFIREGASIIAVETAGEAIRCLNQTSFDIIIGDFASAEKESLKLVKLADRQYPDSIKIAIATSGGIASCPNLEQCRIDDVICKPFPFVSLLYMISQRLQTNGGNGCRNAQPSDKNESDSLASSPEADLAFTDLLAEWSVAD
jgi:DNA-binding NtrC family response regulator